ncbi:hypothetical protein NK6_6462 [Bradyrhizobium diazoefficiens]|uniref:Uncharacterized protein n=1 Tax=Bradyrhizobium diazoefficiens TaxID=1355477 RepID=A0A0E4BSG3_9BRAD|nr:hypothetical protein NK6_6462 [Bradyrhizobium diazoefficiens]
MGTKFLRSFGRLAARKYIAIGIIATSCRFDCNSHA